MMNMQNYNALIAMAHVSENAKNPYAVFCEYIKFCLFSNVTDIMTLREIKDAVGKEFGISIPHNIIWKCLSYLQEEDVITLENHQGVRRKGTFDTESFEKHRCEYRCIESDLIEKLVQYGEKYNRQWSVEYARELLLKVLDRNGMVYDIFLHNGLSHNGEKQSITADLSRMEEMLPDDEEAETKEDIEEVEKQPLFSDSYFVGRFIEEVLAGDTIQKEYLLRICEGMMICVGTYQLPARDAEPEVPQIKGTGFFFDTRLLLRFVDCAGEAAVEAVRELVKLIQTAGGRIYYYSHTLEEMKLAFDEAILNLSNGIPPYDAEMRLYASKIGNSIQVMTAKKASLKKELSVAGIYMKNVDTYSETERIQFGFDLGDLQQYMHSRLRWKSKTIENDAQSIWDVHMRRRGNYSEYCGTKEQLPVFVTSNSRLIAIALGFKEERNSMKEIADWRQNRLPVITDIRLTCRLWSPATQSERLALLYLTANAVAAQRPTRHYINSIRKLAVELGKNVPEYSSICLPAYFDDCVTEAILEKTRGDEDNLDIGSFANTILELAEWRAKEQEEITNKVSKERDNLSEKLNLQRENIIEDAIEENRKRLGVPGIILRMLLCWPLVVTILFAGVFSLVGYVSGSWNVLWVISIPMVLALAEYLLSQRFVTRKILKGLLPKFELAFERKIERNLGKAESPYKDIIIQRTKEQTSLLVKCRELIGEDSCPNK